MARVPKQITGNAGAFDAIKKGGKEFKEVGAGKITHFNNGKKAPLKEEVTAANKGNPFSQYKDGDEIPWPDGKPKTDTWGPVPVNNVRSVKKVPGGVRMEMDPPPQLRSRFNLSDSETVSVKYDNDGYPDFSTAQVHPSGRALNAVPEGGTVKIDYGDNRTDDFTAANEKLAETNPELAKEAGALTNSGRPRKNELDADGDDGKPLYTWHHAEDGESMVLVDYWVHALFKHSGGRSVHNAND